MEENSSIQVETPITVIEKPSENHEELERKGKIFTHSLTCDSKECPHAECPEFKLLRLHRNNCDNVYSFLCHPCRHWHVVLRYHIKNCSTSICPLTECMRAKIVRQHIANMRDKKLPKMNSKSGSSRRKFSYSSITSGKIMKHHLNVIKHKVQQTQVLRGLASMSIDSSCSSGVNNNSLTERNVSLNNGNTDLLKRIEDIVKCHFNDPLNPSSCISKARTNFFKYVDKYGATLGPLSRHSIYPGFEFLFNPVEIVKKVGDVTSQMQTVSIERDNRSIGFSTPRCSRASIQELDLSAMSLTDFQPGVNIKKISKIRMDKIQQDKLLEEMAAMNIDDSVSKSDTS
ncbi:uncharacterized protein LOC103579351 [Microplitis demolitor]|uniref:uncharacterized protein LOC103579351 n=1 Tax=Microplitis demolitor TaxID=69319 RepID=UPI0004CD8346|nr:uncharacterized protein LOC103579351 [Microplitis demolitor]